VSYHGSSKELHFAVCRGGNGWAGAIRWRPDHAAHWEDGNISRGAEVAYCWCGSDTRWCQQCIGTGILARRTSWRVSCVGRARRALDVRCWVPPCALGGPFHQAARVYQRLATHRAWQYDRGIKDASLGAVALTLKVPRSRVCAETAQTFQVRKPFFEIRCDGLFSVRVPSSLGHINQSVFLAT